MIVRAILNRFSPLAFIPLRNFPRNVRPSLKALNKKEAKSKESKKEHTESSEEDIDKNSKEYLKSKKETEEWSLAEQYYPIDKMPSVIVKLAQKVFSKYTAADIRKWGFLLKQNYQRLSSCEHPGDITKVPAFANTDSGNNLKLVKEFKDTYTSTIPLVEENDAVKSEEPAKISNEPQIFKMDYKQAHAVAYLYKKFPHSYFILMRIMSELKRRYPEFIPLSCLDYGAGIGSGVLAAVDTYPKMNKVAACEPSPYMRKLGKLVTKNLKQDILWTDSLTMVPGVGNDRGKFDIVVLSQVLEEIPTPAERMGVIDALWSRVSDGGVFIAVEPGSPKGFRYMHSVREQFIKKSREEACIIAPCPHHGICPKASIKKTWCHFSQFVPKYPNNVIPKVPRENPLDNEKFCYLILKKGKTPNVLFEDESKVTTLTERSYFWPRLVLPAIKKQKHVILDMCTSGGTIERRVIGKSHGADGGYYRARKIHWGDLWQYPLRIPSKFRKETKRGARLW